MKKIYTFVLLSASLYSPTQAQLSLVKPMRLFSTIYKVGNQMLFFGTDDPDIFSLNYELWATDGTAAGTHLVQEIYPGTAIGSIPDESDWDNGTGSYRPFVMDSLLYFTATSPTRAYGLWRSNGTAAGTYLVNSTITFGAGGPFHHPYFCRLGNILFFSGSTTNGDTELWRTDGTAAGTFRVKNISPGFTSEPTNLIVFNGAIYFAAWNENSGSELWKTDGTDAGTVMVKDFYTGQTGIMDANSSSRIFPWFTVSGNYLYFIGDADPSEGTTPRLYRTDGTDAGTIQLTTDVAPRELTDVNGTLFFYGATGLVATSGLYKSDGTPAGTVPIPANNNIIVMPGTEQFRTAFHSFNHKLYFPGAQQVGGIDTHLGIYQSDGTTAGTFLASEIPLHDESGRNSSWIDDPSGTSFLWKSVIDIGTTVSDNRMVQMDGTPNNFKIYYGAAADANGTFFNGDLYFRGRDTTMSTDGQGLYKIHPTLASAPLPVTWLSFDAARNDAGGIDLHWQTAIESNNKGFNIERSSDGKNYSPIHWTAGAGTSSTPHSYTWTDPQPATGKNFYRLQQIDLDGKASYSTIKEIDIAPANGPLIIAPNPLTGNTMIIRHHLSPGRVRVKITDMAGRTMSIHEYTISGSSLSCDIQTLRTGVYHVEMRDDTKTVGSGLFVKY